MPHQPIIYPCIITQGQFEVLKQSVNELSELLKTKKDSSDGKLCSIMYYLGLVIFDIKDLIEKRNLFGYTCNSYMLNMIKLKLDYIYHLIQKYNLSNKPLNHTIITDTHYKISLIIATTFECYKESLC